MSLECRLCERDIRTPGLVEGCPEVGCPAPGKRPPPDVGDAFVQWIVDPYGDGSNRDMPKGMETRALPPGAGIPSGYHDPNCPACWVDETVAFFDSLRHETQGDDMTKPAQPQRPDPTHPDRLFRYHRPSEAQVFALRQIREGCYKLGGLIQSLVPGCPERTLAQRALHTAQQHANFGIVASAPTEAHPSEGNADNRPGGEAAQGGQRATVPDAQAQLQLLLLQVPPGRVRDKLEEANTLLRGDDDDQQAPSKGSGH